MIPPPVVAPCLLVLFRFVSLYAANVGVVSVGDLLAPLGLSLAGVAAVTLLLGRLSGDAGKASLVVCAWTVAFLFYVPLEALLSTLDWLTAVAAACDNRKRAPCLGALHKQRLRLFNGIRSRAQAETCRMCKSTRSGR